MLSSFKKERSEVRIINWHWYAINGLKKIRGEISQFDKNLVKNYNEEIHKKL